MSMLLTKMLVPLLAYKQPALICPRVKDVLIEGARCVFATARGSLDGGLGVCGGGVSDTFSVIGGGSGCFLFLFSFGCGVSISILDSLIVVVIQNTFES